jgi:hypothetical protein
MDRVSPLTRPGNLWLSSGILLLITIVVLYIGPYQQQMQTIAQAAPYFHSPIETDSMTFVTTLIFIIFTIFITLFAIISLILGYGFRTGKIRQWSITYPFGIFSTAKAVTMSFIVLITLFLLDISLFSYTLTFTEATINGTTITPPSPASDITLGILSILFAIHIALVYTITRPAVKTALQTQ